MLGRLSASARLRPHTFPPPVRLATSSFHLINRGYARGRKLPTDYTLPSTAAQPEWQRLSSSMQKPSPKYPTPSKPETPPVEDATGQDYHVAQGQEAVQELNERSQKESQQPLSNDPDPVEQEAIPTTEQATPPEPQIQLPDLRQGIPSTLDAELSEAHNRQRGSSSSLNITEDPAEPPVGGGGGRGGDGLPRSSYVSSSERKRNFMIKYAYLFMGSAALGYTIYLGRNWESEEEEQKYPNAPSGWGISLFYRRLNARLGSNLDYYKEPAFTKLLPDEDKDPLRRFPFVLVLSLEDMLIHNEWTRETGWRIAKRPGLDYFIRYLYNYYEIVLFTSQPSVSALPIYQKLDPFHLIQWPLFREATLYQDGGYVKDLSYLNRPLNKIVMLDTDLHHAKNQPENAIIIPKWNGDPNDQTLIQFIPFLEYLATSNTKDARELLKTFKGTYIPAEFEKKMQALRQKFEAKEAEKRGNRPKRGLGSLLGLTPSRDDSELQSKMPWDLIRESGQKQFEMIDKQIKEEGAKWLAEEAAMNKKAEEEGQKELRKNFFGYFSVFGGKDGEEEKK